MDCSSESSKRQKDHDLICELTEIAQKSKKERSVHSTTYEVPIKDSAGEKNDAILKVQSWKMREWDYFKVPPPFPTLARGLFTTHDEVSGRHRIVARGYDKFFNLGEVPWTAWDPLKKHTRPPYVMTLKSNGCIIFIAALTPSKLIVTSKHALGKLQDAKMSHSQMGEFWLHRHLSGRGKTEQQLARVLWERNWTAVAELCDDSFEEHVLAYTQEKTGLHLHGLNKSSGDFSTELSEDVAKFAREWGFLETAFHSVSSIDEVRNFTSAIAQQGQWNGEPIEGFVVRCHVKDGLSPDVRDAPPYAPGSSFFFKVKYDEPYLMYRDWREITRQVLACKDGPEHANVHKSKLQRPESRLYLEWVKGDIKQNPKLFADFNTGKGVIAARERFLKYLRDRDDQSGMDVLSEVLADAKVTKFGKTVIMPVAIPGCGKTTLSVALSALFGFGHIQSDDIAGKKSAPKFLKGVVDELKTRDVVIADKNNHLKEHRSRLREALKHFNPPVRLLALNWDLGKTPAMMIHRICADRILSRGDNHQTLIADPEKKSHESAVWMFLNGRQSFEDREADEVVNMDIGEDIEQSLGRAIEACVRIIGCPKPDEEDVGRALAVARSYAAPRGKGKEKKKGKESKGPRYYGIQAQIDLSQLLDSRLRGENVPTQLTAFWDSLLRSKRVAAQPHITIAHSKGLPENQQLWDLCRRINTSQESPMFSIKLGHVVCDDRVMAICVDDIKPASTCELPEAKQFAQTITEHSSIGLHLTIGTRSSDINPYEARALVTPGGEAERQKIFHLALVDTFVQGRLEGLYN